MQIFSLSIIALFLSSSLSAVHIHALIAADIITNIKDSSRHDIKNTRQLLQNISESIDASLHVQELTANQLSIKSFNKWIQQLRTTPDDIIFFYFTGHGLRSKKVPSIWPALYFTPARKLIDMNTLVEKIKKVPARLYVILSDCCNNMDRKVKILFLKNAPPQATVENVTRTGYRKLFLDNKGVIIASGSQPGEFAWATESGGVFTHAFLMSLQYEVDNVNPPRWHHIFERIKSLCTDMQKPQYALYLQK